jgi:RNA polymerase sigma factor (sigma-70 family)
VHDDADFEPRFDDLFSCAYRAAYRLLGARADAEDVAIEALARGQVRWGEVAGYAEAWLVRTATNLALDQLRRGPAPSLAMPDRDESSVVERRLDLVRVLRALPRRQRDVVVLRYLGDRPEDEVAEVLGISRGSVKQHASRGLAALRSALTDDDDAGTAGADREVEDVR